MMAQKYWLAENGTVRCLDDRCPQECDMGCPIYLQTMAVPYLQAGHFKQAAVFLQKAVEIEPTFAEAWNNLAACYGQLGNHQLAYDCYKKSFDLLNKPKPLFGMAVSTKNLGKYSEAMQYVKLYEEKYGLDNQMRSVRTEIMEKLNAEKKSIFLKDSTNGRYSLWEAGGRFLFCSKDEKNPEVFATDTNRPVITTYRKLADAILEDLDTYGPRSENLKSLAKWQFDMVSEYAGLTTKEFAELVKKECLNAPDWTDSIDKQDLRAQFFSLTLLDKEKIASWIDKCTSMQLNAILHICRALKSIKIALSLARVLEDYSDGWFDKAEILINWITDNSEFSYSYVTMIFRAFVVYYGIHLDENGGLFEEKINYTEDLFFIGKKISKEILVGRNYYLYEDGLKAKEQPEHFMPKDFLLDCSSDDADDDPEEPDYNELEVYVPERCWIRRINAHENGQESYYLIVVSIDDDDTITEVACIHEIVSQQNGGFFFFNPGIFDNSTNTEYEELDSFPQAVFDELVLLFKGRALQPGFSIIGKPIPKRMKDRNESSSFALQSGYRAAYSHVTIDADDDWCFENLEYSSYQSSNSAYGDMFSRPQTISDREDEAVDTLLHIIDNYSDSEWKEL